MFRIYSLVVQSQCNNPKPAHMDSSGQTGNMQTGGRGSESDGQAGEGEQVADARKGGGKEGEGERSEEGSSSRDIINRRKTRS